MTRGISTGGATAIVGVPIVLALTLALTGSAPDRSTYNRELSGPFLVPPTQVGFLQEFALTPDGTRAVYRGDQLTDGLDELFMVPLDGSAAPLNLSSPWTGVSKFELS